MRRIGQGDEEERRMRGSVAITLDVLVEVSDRQTGKSSNLLPWHGVVTL